MCQRRQYLQPHQYRQGKFYIGMVDSMCSRRLPSNQGNVVEDGLTEWEEDMEYKLDTLLTHLGVQL